MEDYHAPQPRSVSRSPPLETTVSVGVIEFLRHPDATRWPEDCPGILWPDPDAAVVAIPLGAGKVSAGFPSPAADYEDKRLDINEYLIRNAVSTFFFPVQGDSMQGAEIFDGDILVVDKSVEPQHGHIVIAFVEGERLVKRLHNRGGRVALVAENSIYPSIEVTAEMEMVVWGVVVGKFKRLL